MREVEPTPIIALFVERKRALERFDLLDAIAHTLHVILAGAWLGGVVFTTTVISPPLKLMGWDAKFTQYEQ